MLRRLVAIALGEVLVLVGGYFLLHSAFGFVLPQLTFSLPQVNWAAVAAVVAAAAAGIGWNLAWPILTLLVGLLLLSHEWRARARSR